MHETLCNDVKGYIESNGEDGKYSGWCFHNTLAVLPLRLRNQNGTTDVIRTDRTDVCHEYNRIDVLMCGWNLKLDMAIPNDLEMNINGEWNTVFKLSQCAPHKVPSFIVVDNFYSNPDEIRNFALKQNFQENPKFHKGRRAYNPAFLFPGLKEKFEKILGVKIRDWTQYATNGVFQYCVAGDQSVFHCDTQEYAGVLFLTPNAPPEAGTRFYRSKVTKKMKTNWGEYQHVFPTGHLDPTPFDEVDVVGNVYNRIVLFDARMIHAAPTYFGNTLENGRLFQLFFFDLDIPPTTQN